MALIVVLGGVRSGKSRYAERLAAEAGHPVVYVATGAAGDGEMAERIATHRARRPAGWRTVETVDPASALEAAGTATVLVDGLTGWLAAAMGGQGLFPDQPVAAWGPEGRRGRQVVLEAVAAFARRATARPGQTIVVGDEVGLGGVAASVAARRFADVAGEAAQLLAEAADAVWLLVAGQPLAVKQPAHGQVDPLLRLHGDREVAPGALDFAVNVVDAGLPPAAQVLIRRAFEEAGRYPDDRPALSALAARHGRPAGEVLALNGAAEAFWLLASVLQPRRAVCVHPSFTEPEVALRTLGIPASRAFRDPQDFSLDPAAVDPAADLVVVGNPNNPTGNLDPVEVLAALARPGRVLVVDEAFMDFVPGQAASLAGRADLPGVVVVRSLTKVWALAGIRAGYLLGPADLVARLGAGRQPWAVNAPALAALEAYAREPATAAIAGRVAAARAGFSAALAALPGVQVWPAVANFLLIAVPDGQRVRAGLAQRGIAVRRADTFPGLTTHHLRLAVRSPEDNARLVAALGEALA